MTYGDLKLISIVVDSDVAVLRKKVKYQKSSLSDRHALKVRFDMKKMQFPVFFAPCSFRNAS